MIPINAAQAAPSPDAGDEADASSPPVETWRFTARLEDARPDDRVYLMKQMQNGGGSMLEMEYVGQGLWRRDVSFPPGVYRLRHYTASRGSFYLGDPAYLHGQAISARRRDVFVSV